MKLLLPPTARSRIRPPLALVLGSPSEVADLVGGAGNVETVCYQMDLYSAARLREELADGGQAATVVTAPDLWDLPADFQTVLYHAAKGRDRQLKIDMIEQAYHILRPGGTLLVVSPFIKDDLFPPLLKKVFGKFRADTTGELSVFWCQREGDQPRRRHEVLFHARVGGEGPSLQFLSRPGVFSFGRFDEGARALVETMRIEPGDRVLDLGCGCGTNGICAGRLAGPKGHVVFVDSNLRAVAVTEHNAQLNGTPSYKVIASCTATEPARASFDVVLANPPYYARASIAEFFIERARALLKPRGRLYLVTKLPDDVGPLVAKAFGTVEAEVRRGYTILRAVAPTRR